MNRILSWVWQPLAVLLVAAGCGGGGTGGVGSGGTGGTQPSVSVGTVSGFGSIIVDGVEVDDRAARIVAELAPDEFTPVEAKLGQRVVVIESSPGVASEIRVEAEVHGRVDAVAAGVITVLGQRVTVNADPDAGPVTQFQSPYVGLASVAPNDIVEVHAVRRADPGGAVTLQATRVEKESAVPAFLRVRGVVAGLAGSRFKLGDLTVETAGARLLPGGAALADGAKVVVFAAPDAYDTATRTLTASAVRLEGEIVASGRALQQSGVVARHDAAAGRFELDGTPVQLAPGATITPANQSIAEGVYVRARGVVDAAGVLQADQVHIRKRATEERETVLKGTAIDVVAAPLSFEVRGVRVDASAVVPLNCGTALAEGRFVEVVGVLTATGVRATSVECRADNGIGTGNGNGSGNGNSDGRTITARGTASAIDLAAHRFTVTGPTGTYTVQWDDAATSFKRVTPATLEGAAVRVQGPVTAGVLAARQVMLDNGRADED